MCGIAGIVATTDVNRANVEVMVDRLRHRGPHNARVESMQPAVFGHTRLSIIDLSAAAHQPMASVDGRVTLTYNGEIYNFQELRLELEQLGVKFSTRSDTEVLLYGYDRWGVDVFARINGIFACAIWERDTRRLTLARDRFGVKPLYYCLNEGRLLFASELDALLAVLPQQRISDQALSEYLWLGNPTTPLTFFEGIFQLPAAHFLRWQNQSHSIHKYWSLDHVGEAPSIDEAENRVAELLRQAVRRQLVADVPVGVFLSGGVDSSAIAILAAQESERRVHSFFVNFDFVHGRDERRMAQLAASTAGTDHHELHVHAGFVPDVLTTLLQRHGQPFADPADIPLYLMCRELDKDVRVILQGDGGDEIFGGYARHRHYGLRGMLRPLHPLASTSAAAVASHISGLRGLIRVAAGLTGDPAEELGYSQGAVPPTSTPLNLLSSSARTRMAGVDPFRRFRELLPETSSDSPVQRMLDMDVLVLLPDLFLQKVDRATMASGIEVRVPFLDNDLVSYARGLPVNYKVRGGEGKWILKRALRRTVPNEILDAPKQGFGVPVESWLAGPLNKWAGSLFVDEAVLRHDILDSRAALSLLNAARRGQLRDVALLWRVVVLAHWLSGSGSRGVMNGPAEPCTS